jgi:hypothetical protein
MYFGLISAANDEREIRISTHLEAEAVGESGRVRVSQADPLPWGGSHQSSRASLPFFFSFLFSSVYFSYLFWTFHLMKKKKVMCTNTLMESKACIRSNFFLALKSGMQLALAVLIFSHSWHLSCRFKKEKGVLKLLNDKNVYDSFCSSSPSTMTAHAKPNSKWSLN